MLTRTIWVSCFPLFLKKRDACPDIPQGGIVRGFCPVEAGFGPAERDFLTSFVNFAELTSFGSYPPVGGSSTFAPAVKYIGRIQHSGDPPVIFDYRDSKIDYFEKMFKQRNRYYKKLTKEVNV